jgi:predicted enzyme related to lactoylglutathione lyase
MVAGLMAIPEALQAAGTRPCWFGYVGTDDIDADVGRIWVEGGTIMRPPQDIPNVGRFAVVSDPGGAVFLLFQPNAEEEPNPVGPMTTGHVGWHELHAGDLEREFAFYSRLFGWTRDRAIDMGPIGTCQTFTTGGVLCGGMMNRCSQVPSACWSYYIAVDSVTRAAARATELGAAFLTGPMEVLNGAWIVQARDPQGGSFSLISSGP